MKKISELIKDLEEIKEKIGDVGCYHDRFRGGLSDASVSIKYNKKLKDKREVTKFWCEYTDKEDSKGEPIVYVW